MYHTSIIPQWLYLDDQFYLFHDLKNLVKEYKWSVSVWIVKDSSMRTALFWVIM